MFPNENNVQAYMPHFSSEQVREIVKEIYGLEGEVKQLHSYLDQNFLIRAADQNEFVFKIMNRQTDRYLIEGQEEALKHLNQHTPHNFQQVLPSLAGKSIEEVTYEGNNSYYCWMINYVPGVFIAELTGHSDQLLSSLGSFLGSIDKALEFFYHPAFRRYIKWDLQNTKDIKKDLMYISDPGKQTLVNHFLLQFENHVMPVLPELKRGIIHNDGNDYNILVDPGQDTILGIIDFGDMVYTHIINELAIALAYIMMHKDDPVLNVLPVISGYHRIFPLHEKELDILYYLIAARLCISVSTSAVESRLNPENEYINISEKLAWELLEKLTEIDPLRALNYFRNACELLPRPFPGRKKKEILTMRGKYLGKNLSVAYKEPIKIVRGFLQYLFDEEGRKYLDTVNNVSHVGHNHPRIIEASIKQSLMLNTNTRYLHDNIIDYAAKLTSLLPDPLKVCYFTCSGSEANELALRMAKCYSQSGDFIVVDHAYHGNTNACIQISPYKFDGPGGTGCPDHVHKVRIPDLFRGPVKKNDFQAGKFYAEDVKRTVVDIQEKDRKVAAFIFESIAGVAGQVVWPDYYLKEAFRFVREAGGLCIADEVQVGFGRVGSYMWGFQTQGVIPDIVTLGKPIGNGHPVGAVITTREVADAFNNGMEYFNTFGGNPVSCAIGLAVIEVIEEENLQQHALETGSYFKDLLKELQQVHPLIGDVRGLGLFLGIEFIRDLETLEPASQLTKQICERMKEEGILTSVDGPYHNVIKIKPPMPFNRKNVDEYVDRLDMVLREIE